MSIILKDVSKIGSLYITDKEVSFQLSPQDKRATTTALLVFQTSEDAKTFKDQAPSLLELEPILKQTSLSGKIQSLAISEQSIFDRLRSRQSQIEALFQKVIGSYPNVKYYVTENLSEDNYPIVMPSMPWMEASGCYNTYFYTSDACTLKSEKGPSYRLHKSGWQYEGPLEKGKYHGIGKSFHPKTGETYEGAFVNGFREGEGKLTAPDFQYEGSFKAGNMHGKGKRKTILEDGSFAIESGEFEQNYLIKGKYKLLSKENILIGQQNGQFRNRVFLKGSVTFYNDKGECSGTGIIDEIDKYWMCHDLVTNEKDEYWGEKVMKNEGSSGDSIRSGKGRYIGPFIEYTGSFANNVFHGQGKLLVKSTGKIYQGAFEENLFLYNGNKFDLQLTEQREACDKEMSLVQSTSELMRDVY